MRKISCTENGCTLERLSMKSKIIPFKESAERSSIKTNKPKKSKKSLKNVQKVKKSTKRRQSPEKIGNPRNKTS